MPYKLETGQQDAILPHKRLDTCGGLIDWPNIHDAGGEDGALVGGVAKLQVHAASDESILQHRTTPGRAVNVDWRRLRAKCRVPAEKRVAVTTTH